jgi:hypothetical protein
VLATRMIGVGMWRASGLYLRHAASWRPAFAAMYNERLGQRTYRLVYGEDLVPTVAPSSLGFHYVGRYLHCERRGKFNERYLLRSAFGCAAIRR